MHTSTLWTPRRRLLFWMLLIIVALMVNLWLLFFVGQPPCGCSPVGPVDTPVELGLRRLL
jgi:hypothetical protein